MSLSEIQEESVDLVATITEVLEALTIAISSRYEGERGPIAAISAITPAFVGIGTAISADARSALRHHEDVSKRTPGEWLTFFEDIGREQALAHGVSKEFDEVLQHLQNYRAPWPMKAGGT